VAARLITSDMAFLEISLIHRIFPTLYMELNSAGRVARRVVIRLVTNVKAFLETPLIHKIFPTLLYGVKIVPE
jgi:hypothetical protein